MECQFFFQLGHLFTTLSNFRLSIISCLLFFIPFLLLSCQLVFRYPEQNELTIKNMNTDFIPQYFVCPALQCCYSFLNLQFSSCHSMKEINTMNKILCSGFYSNVQLYLTSITANLVPCGEMVTFCLTLSNSSKGGIA